MKLSELSPEWIVDGGNRIGLTFQSPSNKKWRQSCFSRPTSQDDQERLFGDRCIQRCNPTCGWTFSGGIENATFEALTIHPSIDGSAGGLWHGFIKDGMLS